MDVGGRDASHHSATLSKLVRHGLAESEWFGRPWQPRGHKRYRVNEAGRALLEEHEAARRGTAARAARAARLENGS